MRKSGARTRSADPELLESERNPGGLADEFRQTKITIQKVCPISYSNCLSVLIGFDLCSSVDGTACREVNDGRPARKILRH